MFFLCFFLFLAKYMIFVTSIIDLLRSNWCVINYFITLRAVNVRGEHAWLTRGWKMESKITALTASTTTTRDCNLNSVHHHHVIFLRHHVLMALRIIVADKIATSRLVKTLRRKKTKFSTTLSCVCVRAFFLRMSSKK